MCLSVHSENNLDTKPYVDNKIPSLIVFIYVPSRCDLACCFHMSLLMSVNFTHDYFYFSLKNTKIYMPEIIQCLQGDRSSSYNDHRVESFKLPTDN